jgi:hypothetical protein
VDAEVLVGPGELLVHLAGEGTSEDAQDLWSGHASVSLARDELAGAGVSAHADNGDHVECVVRGSSWTSSVSDPSSRIEHMFDTMAQAVRGTTAGLGSDVLPDSDEQRVAEIRALGS